MDIDAEAHPAKGLDGGQDVGAVAHVEAELAKGLDGGQDVGAVADAEAQQAADVDAVADADALGPAGSVCESTDDGQEGPEHAYAKVGHRPQLRQHGSRHPSDPLSSGIVADLLPLSHRQRQLNPVDSS